MRDEARPSAVVGPLRGWKNPYDFAVKFEIDVRVRQQSGRSRISTGMVTSPLEVTGMTISFCLRVEV